MEEREVLHTVCRGDPHGVFRSAVTPIGLPRELLGRVLRIVDQEIDTVDEFPRRVADAVRAVLRLLVVGQVRNRTATEVESVPEGGPDVRDVAGTHLHTIDEEFAFVGVGEIDRSRNAVEAHGEQRRAHQFVEHRLHAHPVVLPRTVHGEHRLGVEKRCEERQALRVVEVRVREQARTDEAGVARQALAAEVPKTGSEIEENRLAAGRQHRDARRVAAVADDVVAMAGRRATHAVESDAERGVTSGRGCCPHCFGKVNPKWTGVNGRET